MNNLTVGSLFSGIGGIDLGLERAGMHVKWQVENNDFCRKVLQKHWPDVTLYGDITELDGEELPHVDVIAGGFPCQDISRAGKRAGITGSKSGLWSEMFRIIRIIRPRYVLVENTTSLLTRGMSEVLGNLAALGYDAEWDCLPAAAFGAPHIRDRVYLLAYPSSQRHWTPHETIFAGWTSSQLHGGWSREPALVRVADGLPRQMDRLRALGNAVVPQVAEWIGRRIVEFDKRLETTNAN